MVIAILLLTTAVQAAPADTTHLSLSAAVERALEANPDLVAQRAAADAVAALPAQASPAFLPSIELQLQGIRTDDPVAVFGLKLRQSNFTAPDFDIGALNNPDPYGGWNAVANAQMPLLAPEGWYGYAAARKAAAASAAGAGRAEGATRFFAIRAYWDAQLAAHQVEALDSALLSVLAHRERAEAMRAQGMVTGLDARLAGLRASELEVRRLAAQAQADVAVSALRAMLALPDSQPIVLTDSLRLSEAESTCDGVDDAECSVDARGDLMAYRIGADAAGLQVKQAWWSQLPMVAAFGSLGHYAQSAPFSEGAGAWTVGIGVTWPILKGLAGPGKVRAARAEHRAAVAKQEAAEHQARLEVQEATRMLEAARQRVDVAAAAEVEAREALDHARLRYQTGAAPITELLDVQAARTAATLNHLSARRDLFVAAAALDLAYGAYDQ
jgi:outer membrane protein TolC